MAIPHSDNLASPGGPFAGLTALVRRIATPSSTRPLGVPTQPGPTPVSKKSVRKSSARALEPKPKKSVDRSMATLLKKLGLSDPKEALLCLPASFSDLREVQRQLPEENDVNRRLYLLRYTGEMRGFTKDKHALDMSRKDVWRNAARTELVMKDMAGNQAIWSVFGSPWAYKDLQADEVVPTVCRVTYFGRRAFLEDVERPPASAVGKMWVKYLGIVSIVAGERVEALVGSQLDNPDAYRACTAKLVGAIGLREDEALLTVGCTEFKTFKEVLMALHQPLSPDHGWMGKDVAHRLAAAAVQASALRHNLRHPHPKSPLAIDPADIEMLARTQPETLSNDQRKAASAIALGLRDPKPLNALLSGDVGTGKTLAYLLPAVAAHRAGAKVVIMAPTTILADQIALQIVSRFGARVKGVERIVAGGKISDHQAILVGTPGITSVATKAKYIPNLLICDEQHKMSAEVRECLVKPWTHLVEVTATPVPRSLASALYGGKEIINIRECPVVKNVQCMVGDVSERGKFAGMLKWALDNGQRAAVIYPMVGKEDTSAATTADVKTASEKELVSSVLSGARTLEVAFPGKVIAIHGQMLAEEIARAIAMVKSGEKPLVVASTVIETGVDIPGITAMVVRDADRFGVSQLHQLRGRLVRHGGEAWFGMMVESADALPPETMARLQAVANCQDGYELAERDLVLRGFGDMEGEAQSGATDSVFRLIKLRPEDFLRRKLSAMAVEGRKMQCVSEPERNRVDQHRLFYPELPAGTERNV